MKVIEFLQEDSYPSVANQLHHDLIIRIQNQEAASCSSQQLSIGEIQHTSGGLKVIISERKWNEKGMN
jgi:hypothetical protein